MQEVETALGDAGDVEVKRLLDALFPDGHLSLGTSRHVHWLLCMASGIDVGHALLRPQLGLFVAVLIVGGFSVEAAKAAPLG
jgi:hypothetical protein